MPGVPGVSALVGQIGEIVNDIFAGKVYTRHTVDLRLLTLQLLAGSAGTEYNLLYIPDRSPANRHKGSETWQLLQSSSS